MPKRKPRKRPALDRTRGALSWMTTGRPAMSSYHRPPITPGVSREAAGLMARNRAMGQNYAVPSMNLSSLGSRNRAAGQNYGVPGMSLAGHTVAPRAAPTPFSPSIGGGGGGGGVGQIGTGGPAPGPAPTATEQGKRDQSELDALMRRSRDEALRREVADLIALEFGPREKENQRAIEELLGIRGREEDYYNQFMGTGTQAIGNIYDLVYGKQKGLQGELNQRMAGARGYEEGLGTKLFEGAPGSSQMTDIMGQLSQSLGSESVANQMLESLSQQHFLNQLTGTTREQAQSAEDFRLQQGSELAQLREQLLGEELGLRHEGRDITEERGLTTRQLTRELEREMSERERQKMLDALDAEIRRGQLGVQRGQLDLERESLEQQGKTDWMDYALRAGALDLDERELAENARQFNLSNELEREKFLSSQLGDPNIAQLIKSQFPGAEHTPIRTSVMDLINGKWGYSNFEMAFNKAMRSAQVTYEMTTKKPFTPEMQSVMREIAMSRWPEAGHSSITENPYGSMSQRDVDRWSLSPSEFEKKYGGGSSGGSTGGSSGAWGVSGLDLLGGINWNDLWRF